MVDLRGDALGLHRGVARGDELLHQSARTRIVRIFLPGGNIVQKELLGPDGVKRARHETGMLERLSSVAGVAKLNNAAHAANAISLQDDGGVPLSLFLRSEKFSLENVLDLALGLAVTIAAIHRIGIVHRDINPTNILLAGPRRLPILIDFQIASSSAQERPAFTAQAEIQGTLGYIAPEQTGRTGRALDHRADLYALGATLYEAAMGHAPFEGRDPFQVICDHLLKVPTPPAILDPEIPQTLSDIIMRLLQKEPEQRYQSADGLAADLAVFIERRARGEATPFRLGDHDFPQRLLPPTRLIGRAQEIGMLRTAFDDALAGRGNGFLIAGAPVVGKTALANELRSVVTAKGGWFVSGKFDRSRLDSESDAVYRAFRNLFRLLLAEPEAELVALRAKLTRALGSNLSFAVATLPELAMLLHMVPEAAQADVLQAQTRLVQIGLDLLRTIAATRPVVFVVDDLQWASTTPLAFLDAVMDDANLPGLLLVGAYRVAEVDTTYPLWAMLSRWKRLSFPPQTLVLQNLERNDLGTLLEEMLRLEPAEAARLAEAVASRTAGNPYDTTELVNALRRDGALSNGDSGWIWDEATIRGYIGEGDVVDLLTTRIDALPPDSGALLEMMACLGGDVRCSILETGGNFSAAELESRLTPALEDGLVVLEHSAEITVRFRHDRVQQAALNRLDLRTRQSLHLTLARRLAEVRNYENIAAEQYVPAIDLVHDPSECLRLIAIFRRAAAQARALGGDVASECFLSAAMKLLVSLPVHSDELARDLEMEFHAALYRVGRLEEGDAVYRSIAGRADEILNVVDSACVQISSLTNRNLLREAVNLGLGLLRKMGLVLPAEDQLDAAIDLRLGAIYRWCDDEHTQIADEQRLAATEPIAIGAAKLIRRMMPPAYFCDHAILTWLVLESLQLWSEYGPQALLVGPISHAGFVTIARLNDYRIGYRVGKHVLKVSEARGFEPEMSLARFLFSLGMEHWFESFEDSAAQARMAHEGLLEGGDLQSACHTYFASIPLLLQSASTLDEYSVEIEAGLAFSVRTGNDQSVSAFLPHRQLARSLRGETVADGSFTDASFDEQTHTAGLADNPTAAVYFHITRALAAYVFDDTPALLAHSTAAMSLISRIAANPATTIAHMLGAVAAARRISNAAPAERTALLAQFDLSHDWLTTRAAAAPENFLHMVRLIEAERAWALGDFANATAAFEAALRDVLPCKSPRHRALISQRAAQFYIEHGLERYGRLLLIDAHQLYGDWGATGKVRRLEADHHFLLKSETNSAYRDATTTAMSSNAIDMGGILRASQVLSSQTDLRRLTERVVEILAGLTGATAVVFIIRQDDSQGWLFTPTGDEDATSMPLDEAGARGFLPLTAFRYVERTNEPLLLTDALRDDRFARDPYFAGYAQCSLLVAPISTHGELRAMLLLENRLGRDAFSPSRLDAVMLIAGQLSVSLENALLYASLERKVAERTEALAAANRQLAQLSLTDALTDLLNRRGFDDELAAQWQRALRTKTSVGLVMIDIDEFKKYNDHYGHSAGDACLRRVAKTFKDGLRPGSDVAARYGGEEFVLILPDTSLAGTYAAAERLRAGVEALREPHETSRHGIVTISLGISAFVPSHETDAARYLEAADVALYEAKHRGRNQVGTSG